MPKIIQNNLKHNTMEFPIYTKKEGGLTFSKILSPKNAIRVINNSIIYENYEYTYSSCFDDLVLKQTAQECTREEFMEAFNKAIETINAKL